MTFRFAPRDGVLKSSDTKQIEHETLQSIDKITEDTRELFRVCHNLVIRVSILEKLLVEKTSITKEDLNKEVDVIVAELKKKIPELNGDK